MVKMNKNTKKRTPKNTTRAAAVKWVAKKFECTNGYVYGVLDKTFSGGISNEVRKAYDEKYAELQQVLS
jgi:hypothetical protein